MRKDRDIAPPPSTGPAPLPEATRKAMGATPTLGKVEAGARFFIDHGVIHDRQTGKHVTLSDDGDPDKGLENERGWRRYK